MAIYTDIDIEITDDGDLVLEDGDLKSATPLRTTAQAIHIAILTNKGELATETLWGADIQTFYGERNTAETRNYIQLNILEALRTQGLIKLDDIEVDVIPTDIHKAAIIVSLDGSFINTDPNLDNYGAFVSLPDGLTMAYAYPFTGGPLTRIVT